MIEVSVVGAWALIELAGEFDVANSGEISKAIEDLVEQAATNVTIDLSRVEFLDAAFIGALIGSQNLLEEAGGRMVLVGATPQHRRVFSVAGISDMLPIAAWPGSSQWVRTPFPPPERVGDPGGAGGDPTDEDFMRQVSRLGELLLTEPTVTGDLRRIVRVAVDLIPGCTSATVALLAQSSPRTAVVSDHVAIEVDVAQYQVGEGPCLQAAANDERIRIDFLAADERFVHFAPHALEAGIQAVLSIPVALGGEVVGSVNCYSTTSFSADAGAIADVIATQVATAIAKTDIYAAAHELAQSAQERANNLSDINITRGILAGLHQCSIDQADRLLRSAATANNEALVDAARRIITYVSSPRRP